MPSHPSLLETCDRTRSKEARQALKRILWDSAEWRNLALPKDCPLTPSADVLLWQERTKKPISSSHWRCGLCGKNFRSEFYLDKHLARKHATAGSEEHASIDSENTMCLADLCGISVPCLPTGKHALPSVSTVLVRREDESVADGMPSKRSSEDTTSSLPRICTDSVEQLAARHACSAAIERCVTLDATSSESDLVRVRTSLHGALCDDAHDVECATWAEKVTWRSYILSDEEISTRHTLGWIALLLICVVYTIGRYANRLRRGDDDFARPQRRMFAWLRESGMGKRD